MERIERVLYLKKEIKRLSSISKLLKKRKAKSRLHTSECINKVYMDHFIVSGKLTYLHQLLNQLIPSGGQSNHRSKFDHCDNKELRRYRRRVNRSLDLRQEESYI